MINQKGRRENQKKGDKEVPDGTRTHNPPMNLASKISFKKLPGLGSDTDFATGTPYQIEYQEIYTLSIYILKQGSQPNYHKLYNCAIK